MSNFIEVLNTENTSVLINKMQVFKVEPAEKGTRICIAVKGFNHFAYQYVDTYMSYQEIRKLFLDIP